MHPYEVSVKTKNGILLDSLFFLKFSKYFYISCRWTVKLNDSETYHKLLKTGVCLNGMKIAVRTYDSVLEEEYLEYQKYDAVEQAMLLKLAQLKDLRKGRWPVRKRLKVPYSEMENETLREQEDNTQK